MPPKLQEMPRVTLLGPFWSAEADLVHLADPQSNWAFRTLFLDATPRPFVQEANVFLPGTMLALVWPRSVQILPAGGAAPVYEWQRASGAKLDDPLAGAKVKGLLESGDLALLLVHADPGQWREKENNKNKEKHRFGALSVLAGDLSLERLRPRVGALDRLYRALALEATAVPAGRTGAARLLGQVSVHASGATLYGQVRLPWEAHPLAGVFQLARRVPDPDLPTGGTAPGYRLTLEEDRMTAGERDAFAAAWSHLSDYLNPAHPTHDATGTAPAPRWVTLELARQGTVPRLQWEAFPWSETPAELPLHFIPGEITLLLSDASPYGRGVEPTTLAQVLAEFSVVRQGTGLIVRASASVRGWTGPGVGGTLHYDSSSSGGAWTEAVTLAGVPLAFSPVATPRLLREVQGLPVPEWVEGADRPVDPPVLWGFVPLSDGWVQLPVPNLTEQIYLDAKLARDPDASIEANDDERPETILQGAVAFGNGDLLAAHPAEQSWSLTLVNAGGIAGTWTLQQEGGAFRLAAVSLTAHAPDVSLGGLLWLGTERPTAADALPALEDWTAGLAPVSLRTARPGRDVFPAPVLVVVEQLAFTPREEGGRSGAELGGWSVDLQADPKAFQELVAAAVLPVDTFSAHLPLVWRRHPALPMVQALPLTQRQTPPNHPSASRQLVPFALSVNEQGLPRRWRFGVAANGGAARWPALLGDAFPAKEWTGLPDLPLVSLSLPGMVLYPFAPTGAGHDPGLGLDLQYRFDLPYTDEPNALAQLPRAALPDTAAVDGGVADASAPLDRTALGAHWARLSELAKLAAADAVTAFAPGGDAQVRHLVEPRTWPVRVEAALAAYPGSLTLDNSTGVSAPLVLKEDAALEGMQGRYAPVGTDGLMRLAGGAGAEGAYQVTAGSVAARVEADGRFRDGRGLLRGATAAAAGLLRTPVRLEGQVDECVLTSALTPVDLDVPGAVWRFWFRDLPVQEVAFDRSKTLSGHSEDINDPEALAREQNYRAGYEWRLSGGTSLRLPFCGLDFYPLTLERVAFADEAVAEVEIVGRLQLPVVQGGEFPELSTAVRAIFTADAGRLVLTSVARVDGPPGEWPLAMEAGEAGDAPRIVWREISLDPATGVLSVGEARLQFFLFGAGWEVPLEPLRFSAGGPAAGQTFVFPGPNAGVLAPREVALEVDPATGTHTASLLLEVRLGSDAGPRATLLAGVRFHLLGEAAMKPDWETAFLFDDLEIPIKWEEADNRALVFAGNALQFTWRRADVSEEARGRGLDLARLQLLPGMHLGSSETPGFAAVAFEARDAVPVPALHSVSSFVETMLHCRWGAFLQEPALAGEEVRRVLGSSAGDLVFGYTGERRGSDPWRESLLLNGFLEVKDLASWPVDLAWDATKFTLTLPAARTKAASALAHTRHTARILLNQHVLPSDVVVQGPGDLLFQIAPGKSWQFLAVVEHQLVEVTPGLALDVFAVDRDRRWSTVQEVRVTTPAAFRAFLRSHPAAGIQALDPARGVVPLGQAASGYLGSMRTLLAEGTAAELDRLPPQALVVEAAGLHWVRQRSVEGGSLATLQYLPNATQMAVMSEPQDFGPSDPADPAWLLLPVPLLGRLQDTTLDGLEGGVGDAGPLQVDPVLVLHRRRSAVPAEPLPPLALGLASWGDAAPVRIAVSALDAPQGRLFARLDPLSLEEGWYRLQHPLAERTPEVLQSLLAALPDTAARLSRPLALHRAFDPSRSTVPPTSGDEEARDAQDPTGPPVWRPGALWTAQGVTDRPLGAMPPYGWYLTGVLLASSGLSGQVAGSGVRPRLHPAATVLPVRPLTTGAPMALAVSPYLGVELRPAVGAFQTRLVFAELLALNPSTRSLLPVANRVWELPEGGATLQDVAEQAREWAADVQTRLAPESPLALLRFRELNERTSQGTGREAPLSATYGFAVVEPTRREAPLARRVFSIRSPVTGLRFREGHFGGGEMPEAVRPFELAPPQTTGVQPLYLTSRPEPGAPWPWGMSALSVAVRYTAEGAPVIGHAGGSDPGAALTLWWQAPQHRLQFRSAVRGEGKGGGLPRKFRAEAIRAFLPVLPDPPLPRVDASLLAGTAQAPHARWHPVLPGSLRYLLLGARAGAMLAVRHQILRQGALVPGAGATAGTRLVSGSVPAQHRFPRPVPLPPNHGDAPDLALRTWASPCEPLASLRHTAAPADEAFFAASGSERARRLRMTLQSPAAGALAPGWDGTLRFEMVGETDEVNAAAEWTIALELADGDAVYAFAGPEATQERHQFRFTLVDPGLLAQLATREVGGVLALRARVSRAGGTAGFFQALTFPLRIAGGVAALPLEPAFVHFEDPEYNRRLASAAALASKTVKTREGDQPTVSTVTLAADRREYNPDSLLSLRYDWDSGQREGTAAVLLRTIDASGVASLRTLAPEAGLDLDRVPPGTLVQVPLGALLPGPPRTGETLQVELRVEAGERIVETTRAFLALDVVADPVQPVPEAAYALLRRTVEEGGGPVECVRFAWGPQPARVELVAPDDLRTGIVRRRAVFHWTDTARRGRELRYGLQKVARTGATHLLALDS
jgi:hypothetical protein